jgi:hypothetical protein
MRCGSSATGCRNRGEKRAEYGPWLPLCIRRANDADLVWIAARVRADPTIECYQPKVSASRPILLFTARRDFWLHPRYPPRCLDRDMPRGETGFDPVHRGEVTQARSSSEIVRRELLDAGVGGGGAADHISEQLRCHPAPSHAAPCGSPEKHARPCEPRHARGGVKWRISPRSAPGLFRRAFLADSFGDLLP